MGTGTPRDRTTARTAAAPSDRTMAVYFRMQSPSARAGGDRAPRRHRVARPRPGRFPHHGREPATPAASELLPKVLISGESGMPSIAVTWSVSKKLPVMRILSTASSNQRASCSCIILELPTRSRSRACVSPSACVVLDRVRERRLVKVAQGHPPSRWWSNLIQLDIWSKPRGARRAPVTAIRCGHQDSAVPISLREERMARKRPLDVCHSPRRLRQRDPPCRGETLIIDHPPGLSLVKEHHQVVR